MIIFVCNNNNIALRSVIFLNPSGLLIPRVRTASKEVILELIKSKCLPILLYGLEACPFGDGLDFSVNRFFMKLFNTSDIQTVTECQLIFDFKLPSAIIADKTKRFIIKYDSVNNLLFKLSRLPL